MIINQKQIISIFFFALLIFVLMQLGMIFSPFFEAFLWAAMLVFAFYPLYRRAAVLIKNPTLASFLMTALIVTLVIVPSVFVLERLANQAVELYDFIADGGMRKLAESVEKRPWVENLKNRASELEVMKRLPPDWPARVGRTLAGSAASRLASTTKNLVGFAFNLVVIVFFAFFLFRNGRDVYLFFYDLVPLERRDKAEVFGQVLATFESVIRGQFLTSVAQALLTGGVFLLLGLPAPHFFGFVTFLASLVPILGASIVWFPFSVYLALVGETAKGLILFLAGAFGISLCDNVLKAVLIGGRTKIPVALLFLGVLGGIKAYGVVGLFLGPIFIALFFTLIRIYRSRYP